METKVEQKVVESEFAENENANDSKVKVTVNEDGKAKKFWKKNKKWIIGATAGVAMVTFTVLKCVLGSKNDEDDVPLLEAPEDDDEESEDEEE